MQAVLSYLFKSFTKSIVIGMVISCLLVGIEMMFGQLLTFDAQFIRDFGYKLLFAVILTMINATYFDYFYKKIVWKKYAKYKIVLGALGNVFLTLIGIFLIRLFISVWIEDELLFVFLRNEEIHNYFISFLITMVVSLFFHAFYFYKKLQENKVKEQKIIAGTASAKFESLKNQIDPHFLFNSLNVLSSLIEENPDNAQRFTTSLSKIYRYVLEQKDKELVSVSEELSFAKTYMDLLKMRFENSLFYTLPDGIPNPEAKVVPLSLQLLLENTVKHNIASEQKPLSIRIYVDGDYLAVENIYQKKEVLQDRQGVGLQNIVSRYSIITNRNVLVEQNEKTFTVKIPILTKQITVMETHDKTQESNYYKAQKKVEDIKGFYGNLTAYILVNTGLIIVNILTSTAHLWFFYPLIGWGIGVVFHGMSVFNYMPFLGSDWEEKKIKELMDKEQAKKWN